jgi:hypothetical protein
LAKADHHLTSTGAARFAKAGALKQNLVGIGGLRTHIRTVPGESPFRLLGAFFGVNEGNAFCGRALHTLVEGFSVFGVHVQYWMLIAALIVAIAVVSSLWK